MKCPRCGAENQESRQQCYLCQTPLKDPFFHPTTASGSYATSGSSPSSPGYPSPQPWHPASGSGGAYQAPLSTQGGSSAYGTPYPQPAPGQPPRPTSASGTWSQWTKPDTGPVMQHRTKDTRPAQVQQVHTLTSPSHPTGPIHPTPPTSGNHFAPPPTPGNHVAPPPSAGNSRGAAPQWNAFPQQAAYGTQDYTTPSTPGVGALQAHAGTPATPYHTPSSNPRLPASHHSQSASNPGLPSSYHSQSASNPGLPASPSHLHRPQPSAPLGMGRNIPHTSQSQQELSDYLPEFDEKTVVDALERLESKPDLLAMPASSQTIDESTSINDPVAALPQRPVKPSPVAALPPQPVRPSPPQPPPSAFTGPPQPPSQPPKAVQASPPSPVSFGPPPAPAPNRPVPTPVLPPSLEEATAPAAPAGHQERSGSDAENLPFLPKPRLPEGFVFAAKAQVPALWRRSLAGLIDLTLLVVLAWTLTALFGPPVQYKLPEGLHIIDWVVIILPKYQPQIVWGLIAFVSIYMIYTVVLHSLGGKTLGKRLLRIRVVTSTGRPINWFGSFARGIAFLLFTGLNLVGLFWILLDREYRGLHDRVSGSIVIQDNPSYPLPSN